MKIIYKNFFFLIAFGFVGCSSLRNNPLEQTLKTPKGIIHQVMQNPEEYEVQIIYSQIKRTANGKVSFIDFRLPLKTPRFV